MYKLTPLQTPVKCCFGHDPCPYKSCGLQNNIERGEGGGEIIMVLLRKIEKYVRVFNLSQVVL